MRFLALVAIPLYAAWALRAGAPQLVWTGIVTTLCLVCTPPSAVANWATKQALGVASHLAPIIPPPSPRPALRAAEIGALAMLAAACATAATAARDRARSIKSRVLAATAAITTTLHPRLATSIVARHAASSAA